MARIRSTIYVDAQLREEMKIYCVVKNITYGDTIESLFDFLLSHKETDFEKFIIKGSMKRKCERIEARVQKIRDNYNI